MVVRRVVVVVLEISVEMVVVRSVVWVTRLVSVVVDEAAVAAWVGRASASCRGEL